LVPRVHKGQAKRSTAWCTSPWEVIITTRTTLVGGGAASIGFAVAARLAADHRVVNGTVLTVDGGRTETV
jgi:hypothetical protein